MAQQMFGQTPFSNPQAQESRYGATAGYGDNQNSGLGPQTMYNGEQQGGHSSSPIDAIRDPAAYGFQKTETGFKFPGVHAGHTGGHQQTQQQPGYGGSGMQDPYNQQGPQGNHMVGTRGMQDMSSYNQQGPQRHHMTAPNAVPRPSQAGYGNSPLGMHDTGFNQQQGMQGSYMAGPNAYPSHAGYGHGMQAGPQEADFAQPQPGYGQPGFGAPTEGQNTTSLWPKSDGDDQPQQQGGYDGRPAVGHQHAGLLYGEGAGRPEVGESPAAASYGSNHPDQRTHDRPSEGSFMASQGPYGSHPVDATHGPYAAPAEAEEGLGEKNSVSAAAHPGEAAGFGGGLGAPGGGGRDTGYDASTALGDGYDKRVPTGVEAYVAPGAAKHAGTDAVTGLRDSELGTDVGATRYDPTYVGGGGATGDHYTTPGYDGSAGLNGNEAPRRETLGEKLKNEGGAGHPDSAPADYPHQDATTTTGLDDVDVDYPHQDPNPNPSAYGATAAPHKRSIFTKIKEKLKH